jgi:ribosomal protein L14
MVQCGTWVKIVDNSGGLVGKCIRIYRKDVGKAGDCLMVTLKKARSHKKLQKGQLVRGVLVRDTKNFSLLGGHFGCCSTSAIVLLKGTNEILGTRINEPVFNKLKGKGFLKILTLSANVY